ncbi:MAG: beta-glucosidase [Bacteroidetes bacterium GWE2_41_25]|nr:MAG: beta-glucosidase [Bacteroidetes bacterium GWA2_40_15]OFX96079.1 MAG: beta-glucosidase [Bacteroidetes bacterium GWE2_41_25]HAM09404.1 beta-glucosidase [Bacteroidales bacterium]HBQ84590.1 beta-glucosidase [Bacteroidales bacterium]HCU19548.1 beta-glucosidase [Bacteroidales bacterium]
MKKFLKIPALILVSLAGVIILFLVVSILWITVSGSKAAKKYMALAGDEVQTLTLDHHTFRDLNKNGRLDVYEDNRCSSDERVRDLLSMMTLEEKAGLMFIPPISINRDGTVAEKPSVTDIFSLMSKGSSELIYGKKINHFNIFMSPGKKAIAEWYNQIQRMAERSRLGIPVTIASDPRNSYSSNFLASIMSGDFSAWPEPLGLAAIHDSATTFQFADIARQEYLAAGIRLALHPMADLATEPRWGRINGTFGEDAQISAMHTYAYIKGFQGDSLGSESVACMTKHFSGGGPQKEGIDPHFPIAKGQIYPGNNFDYHLIPFEAAFRANTAGIMPYYGIPTDQTSENVGFGFNKDIITGLLRNKYHFDGVICTDWGLITDIKVFGIMMLPARARGMEHATYEERMLKIIEAGCDQFGGEMIPGMLVDLVMTGKVSEARLDTSVIRLLRVKFELGLFDNPFVDVNHSVKTIGNPDFMAAGRLAQRKSIVLLKNSPSENGKILPLKEGARIFVMNIKPETASKYGMVMESPDKADFAVIRIKAPTQFLKGSGPMGRLFSSGDLNFKEKELTEIIDVLNEVPSITDIYLDRPAVIPEIASASKGLLANFGADDEALLDVIFGRFNPSGRLPFEMAASMEAVRNQKEDLPYDSKDPLFPFGFGLNY